VIKEKSLIAVIAFIAGIGTVFFVILIFDIDLIKWANCSAPFASEVDKESDLCRR